MVPELTKGFVQQVFVSGDQPEGVQPILQALSVKKINAAPSGSGTPDRHRVILSDGEHFCQAMLATQLNGMVDSKELDKHSIVRLTSFVTNSVQGRKLIIILGIETFDYKGDKIGNPANIEPPAGQPAAGGGSAAAPAPAAANGRVKTEGAPRGGPAPGHQRQAQRPGAGGGKDVGPLFPIEGLSPYQNKWTIKARVTAKSEIKHYSNQKGEGKVFNVTFMDETGEIRATGFNDQVDSFYELLEEGKVYFVSKARTNIAKKQFNNVNNEYEIMFERETEISPCDDASVPQVKYNFRRVEELGDCNKDDLIDIIGVVREVHELGSVTSKATNKPLTCHFAKRDIQLVDQSNQAVRLTLWGKQAESFHYDDSPVIAFKQVKVGDFGGRSLSMFSSATMTVNPDINEAHALRGWYDSVGRNATFNSYSSSSTTRTDTAGPRLTELKTIGDAKDENLGMRDKVDFFTTSAVVAFIKSEMFSYPACANPDGCNKKVTENGPNDWVCDKCDKHWPAPIHRYILSMNCMDHTSSFWITAFNEVAEKILGISANDLMRLKEDGDDVSFQSYFTKASGRSYTFEMMAKQDSYNDQVRVRYTCRKANIPDYAAESQWLSDQIARFGI